MSSAGMVPFVDLSLPTCEMGRATLRVTTHREMHGPLFSGCPQAYEKQRGARREEQKELQRAAAQDQVRGFLEKEAAIVSRPLNPFTSKAASGTTSGEERQTWK